MTPAKSTRRRCSRGCGRETRRSDGVCFRCFRGDPRPVPSVEVLGDPAIIELIRGGLAELRRRRLETDELLRQLVEEVAARASRREGGRPELAALDQAGAG